MNHVSYAQFHNDPAKYMDEVAKGKTPLHVTREGQPDIVMVSEDEYNGWMETVHLLSTPANAERILKSIAEADAGKLEEHALIER